MKLLIVFMVVLVGSQALPSLNIFSQEWNSFKELNKKIYKSASEEMLRLKIFIQNKIAVLAHHAKFKLGQSTFDVEMNHFGDLLEHEFKALSYGLNLTLAGPTTRGFNTFLGSGRAIPASYDARLHGLVNTPRHQRTCGSCWSFSTTGAIEGHIAKKTGRLIALSQQNLVDCSLRNYGCGGGFMTLGFDYVRKAGGIASEAAYPYEARIVFLMLKQGPCTYDPRTSVASITGYEEIRVGSARDLKDAIANVGPVSVGIDASSNLLTFYKHGIFSVPPSTCTKLNHGVVAVGYGTEQGHNYWIIKNSWGAQWGEGGFLKLLDNGRNLCGILNMASFPTV